MKVAHVLPFSGVGGTELATLRIALAVRPFGIESVAYCFENDESLRTLLAANAIPAIQWPAPQSSIRGGVRFFKQSLAFARELKRQKVDLLHCQNVLAGYHAALAGRLAHIPVLCHVRGRYSELPWRDTLFLRPSSHFAFVSADTWKQFAMHVTAARGTVVYDGIALPEISPGSSNQAAASEVREEFGIPVGSVLIGMFARLAREKDFPTLVRGATIVISQHPEAYFLVIGDNEGANYAHYCQVLELLRNAGIADHFRFTGFRRDVDKFMKAIDLSVLSTHTEGMPLVVLEAMAHGKPVVATDVDGIPELIAEGTGYVYPHADSHALAARIVELIEQPDVALRMGREGRSLVENKFSQKRFAESMFRLYDALVPPGQSANERERFQ